mmetsp:Transcript_6327/g.13835  ORF Transcript_6327/g.13835 Transcript_6327/m.13835 type:complete len:225 (+) Transcript_6327:62-736(+)
MLRTVAPYLALAHLLLCRSNIAADAAVVDESYLTEATLTRRLTGLPQWQREAFGVSRGPRVAAISGDGHSPALLQTLPLPASDPSAASRLPSIFEWAKHAMLSDEEMEALQVELREVQHMETAIQEKATKLAKLPAEMLRRQAPKVLAEKQELSRMRQASHQKMLHMRGELLAKIEARHDEMGAVPTEAAMTRAKKYADFRKRDERAKQEKAAMLAAEARMRSA